MNINSETKVLCSVLCIVLFFLTPLYAFQKAEDFLLPSLQGGVYRLSDFKGKVVVINFWASWCRECIKEMPQLEELYRRYKDKGLVVIGINIDRSKQKAALMIKNLGISYPVLHDEKGDVFIKKYTVVGLPSTFIVDKEGRVVARLIGQQNLNSEEFIQTIERLLYQDNRG
jgi:peroxiredoxin